MFIKAENSDPFTKKTKSLCYFVTEKSDLPLGFSKSNQKLTDSIKEAVKETKAKLGAISIVHTHGIIPAHRILIAGLGSRHKITHESLRLTSGKIAKKVSDIGLDEYCLAIPNNLGPRGESNPCPGIHSPLY